MARKKKQSPTATTTYSDSHTDSLWLTEEPDYFIPSRGRKRTLGGYQRACPATGWRWGQQQEGDHDDDT